MLGGVEAVDPLRYQNRTSQSTTINQHPSLSDTKAEVWVFFPAGSTAGPQGLHPPGVKVSSLSSAPHPSPGPDSHQDRRQEGGSEAGGGGWWGAGGEGGGGMMGCPGLRGVAGYKPWDSGLSVAVLLLLRCPPSIRPSRTTASRTSEPQHHLRPSGRTPPVRATMLTILALASLVLLGTGRDGTGPLDSWSPRWNCTRYRSVLFGSV